MRSPPSSAEKKPVPSRSMPPLSMEEVVMLLGLPASKADKLRAGDVFTGPSGLAGLLTVEMKDDVPVSARPTVMLGLKASELAGSEVQQLLELQTWLMSSGLWYLGAAADGELHLTALQTFNTSEDVASAIDLANVTAWVALSALLETMGANDGTSSSGEVR